MEHKRIADSLPGWPSGEATFEVDHELGIQRPATCSTRRAWGALLHSPLVWGSAAVGAVLAEEFATCTGAVGVAGEGEHFSVMDEAVDHGCGDDVVGEGFAPAANGRFEVTMIEPCS